MWWYWLGLVGGRIIRMWLGLIVLIIFEKKRWSFIVDTICKWTFIFNLIMLNKVFFIFNISLICFVGHPCTITNLASLPSIVCYQTISCLWAASILSRRSSLCYITSWLFLSICCASFLKTYLNGPLSTLISCKLIKTFTRAHVYPSVWKKLLNFSEDPSML